jgi:hypothetical protein
MPARAADDRKLRELILYVLQRSQDDLHMGATKLNKVLFRSDFGSYLHLGKAITWHPYFKLANGPAPRHLLEIRKGMVADGLVRITRVEIGADKPMDRWQALRAPDLASFTREELAFVDGVIEAMSDQSGQRAADDTHLMVGWRLAGMRQDIPYETALLADRASAIDIARGRELARENGWS